METLLDEVGELRARFEATLRHEHGPFLKTDYLGIRLDGKQTPAALRDVRVRQAMSLALDRHGLAEHLRRNAVTPTDHFVPPKMLGWAAPPPVVQDLEQARALLWKRAIPKDRVWVKSC